MCFVAHLFEQGFAPPTIATHISAIAYAHKIMGAPDPTDQFVVRKLLSGASRLACKPDTRLPITPTILQKISETLGKMNFPHYHQTMFRAIYTLAFFAFLRIGELALPTAKSQNYVVQLKDIAVQPDSLQLNMHTYKHSASHQPVTLHIQTQPSTICPVKAMVAYLALRGNSQGPLFCFPDLQPLTKAFVTSNLALVLQAAGLDPKVFKGHSFRIGAATYAASQGQTSTQIQQMGRWHSSAFQKYIRIDSIRLPGTPI